ncbi:glucitol operon activator protein [Paraburkholderia rhizosphaerae]|uniref:Glucitol operon activator protein n=2 Tax=Paraburkholderia rhizosphaerae TaxID=480658 RepID=A0A4R8LPL7_9BURK|nr:glucitol operon activator protein [Paraburkholderia rhizosphaerae]
MFMCVRVARERKETTMDYVRGALLALAVFWAMQVVASWFQMRRYGDALRRTARRWHSGFLGVGACKVRFGRGAIAMVVLDDALVVREFLSMSGLTVFSRFRQHDGFSGLSIEEFNIRLTGAGLRRSIVVAAADALERAQRTAQQQTGNGDAADAADADNRAARLNSLAA